MILCECILSGVQKGELVCNYPQNQSNLLVKATQLYLVTFKKIFFSKTRIIHLFTDNIKTKRQKAGPVVRMEPFTLA